MIYYYTIYYRIYKNNQFYLNHKVLDFRELVEFISFEFKKHGHNFEVESIKPKYSGGR